MTGRFKLMVTHVSSSCEATISSSNTSYAASSITFKQKSCLVFICMLTLYLQDFCTTRSHGEKSHMLMSKLHSGTYKTMHLPLFWKSHCATCLPVYVILYHVTRSCKGPSSLFLKTSSCIISVTISVNH